uniref:uncharacterized protein LOC122580602 n=1 Tax=Erigeron canadensis TaxID=72917 RepID=UPI001CB9C44F|nr:uncharacterized protein LOC122580602 [Erigeron canadensis]
MGQSVETLPLLMDETINSHKQAGRKKSRAGRKKLRAGRKKSRAGRKKSQAGRKKSRKFRESVARIQSCWNDLISHVVQGKKVVFSINSELLEFEKLLMKLPPKKRSLFQPSFSSLCAETNSLKNEIAHSMKMQFNATVMQSIYYRK